MIDRKKKHYDACSEKRNKVYDAQVYKYIGKGRIHKFGHVIQTGQDKYHFWEFKG